METVWLSPSGIIAVDNFEDSFFARRAYYSITNIRVFVHPKCVTLTMCMTSLIGCAPSSTLGL